MEYRVFDAHCDTLCSVLCSNSSLQKNNFHVDIERMSKYKGYTQVFACFIDNAYRSCALDRFIRLSDIFHNQKFWDNVRKILSVEGADMITDVEHLHMLYREGVRIIALTWNYSNHIASGAGEGNHKRGLTEFGRKIVREMNRLNMIIDMSHLNDQSFYDIAQISTRPIVATHSCSRTVCSHRRNLTDDMFKMVHESGGCVGVNFYPYFLTGSEKAGIDDIVRHIEYFMSLGGENNIGIGADFDGVDCLPEGICGCEDMYKLFDRLLQLNYTEEQVEKISHKNFERIMNGVI